MIKKLLTPLLLLLLTTNVFAVSPNDPENTEADIKNIETELTDELGLSDLIKNQTQPLPATEAFQLNLSTSNDQLIKADWNVVDGHYIYQGKIKLDILKPNTGLTLSALNLPAGKTEIDAFFGEVTTYNKDFSVTAKVDGEQTLLEDDITLKASYQGCSKVTGICYPPQHETLKLRFTPDQLASSSTSEITKTVKAESSAIETPESEVTNSEPKADYTPKNDPVLAQPTPLFDSAPTDDTLVSSPVEKSDLASQFGELKVDSAEPLHPDQAFIFDLTAADNTTLNARWDIIPGHYLYQGKIKFELQDAQTGVSLGEAIIPEGKKEHDEYFGDVITHNKSFDVKLPLLGNSEGSLDEVIVKTSYQGCSKLTGICYPPQHKTQTVKLEKGQITSANTEKTPSPSVAEAPDTVATAEVAATKIDDEEPLLPDEAFAFDLTATDNITLNAHWEIVPGHYLYQGKIKFQLQDAQTGISLGQAIIPQGKEEHDEFFGDIITHNESFDVKIPLLGNLEGVLDEVTIKTSYQGCSKITGICYAPQHKTQTVKLEKGKVTEASSIYLDAEKQAATATTTDTENTETASEDEEAIDSEDVMVSEQDALVNKLNDSGYGSIFLFFLLGLGLTFTPCVFPMIPILSGIIAGQGSDTDTRKSFFLSLSYVLAMALTYSIVGVIAALSGENLAVALQTPGVIYSFAILFVILSLSMFGFYELQMPAFIQNKLTNISNGQEGGNLVSAGIMGALSALIVGPCVTAPLIALIVFIAESKDVLLGGLSLFALGMGMGVPLLIIGTGAGKVLPNAGAWMDNVKHFFGIMMIALAIWMLDRVLPTEIIALLAGILLVFSAVYMKALDTIKETATGWSRFFKSTAIIILIYGIVLIISAASGSASLFSPLKSLTGGGGGGSSLGTNIASAEKLNFKKVKSIEDLEQAVALANSNGQAAMLDFYADWCVSCKEWEGITFADSAVISALQDTVLLKADVTENDDIDKAITKKFGLVGPPAIVFFDKAGAESEPYKIVGYKGPEDFLAHLDKFKATLK